MPSLSNVSVIILARRSAVIGSASRNRLIVMRNRALIVNSTGSAMSRSGQGLASVEWVMMSEMVMSGLAANVFAIDVYVWVLHKIGFAGLPGLAVPRRFCK